MKRLLIIPFLSLICITAAAQYKTQTGTPYNARHIVGPTMNRVKTMVESTLYEGAASARVTEYVFNYDGTLAAKITTNTEEDSDYYREDKYQWSDGKLISITSSEGVPINLQHDSKGNLIKESKTTSNGGIEEIVYSYNSNNMPTEIKGNSYYDGEESSDGKYEFYWEYENGMLIKAYGWGCEWGQTNLYQNGILTRSNEVEPNCESVITYEYTYNEFDNWIQRVENTITYFLDVDPYDSTSKAITTRKYTYFE